MNKCLTLSEMLKEAKKLTLFTRISFRFSRVFLLTKVSFWITYFLFVARLHYTIKVILDGLLHHVHRHSARKHQ